MSEQPAEIVFVSRVNPNMRFAVHVVINAETGATKKHDIQFQNRRWATTDLAVAEALREQIRTRPAVSQHIQEVDRSAAEALVAAHLANRRPAAAKGAYTTEHTKLMMGNPSALAALTQGLSTEEANKVAEDMAKDGLLLTEEAPVEAMPAAESPQPPATTHADPAVEATPFADLLKANS